LLRLRTLLVLITLAPVAFAIESPASIVPETVAVPSGKLRLKAFFWKPLGSRPFPAVLFNHGSGGPDADHTAGMPITEAAEKLAPLFLKHGYALLYLFRRGQGPSADQGLFMQDILRREEANNGENARQHLQLALATKDHLHDVLAALSFLKTAPGVDAKRIAIVGHSFGGQLTLLAAGRDTSVRAAVTFAAAAGSWERSPQLREQLRAAVGKATAPIMLIQAANDYSTAPSQELAGELRRLHKSCVLKIYPPVGRRAEDGHNFLYLAIPQWEHDVFNFLNSQVKP
jgi:carboxymethylenebutenolidase